MNSIPAALTQVDWVKFRDQVMIGDGHTIYSPEQYRGVGLPADCLVERTFKSDTSSHKSTIYLDGKEVKQVAGINHLSLLRHLAGLMDADTTRAYRMNGRGSEAQALVEAMAVKLKEWGV